MDKELLEAIGQLIREENAPVNKRLDVLEAGQAKLEGSVTKLEIGQAKLDAGQAKLEATVTKLEAGQAKLEAGQKELAETINWMRGSMFRMETEHLPKISAALAAMDDSRHRLDGHEQRIETAEDEIVRHANRIAVLELART
jgi:RND superfamily putative drug exporter